jgi:putative ABC transport system ATP-binding protein
MPLLEIKSLVKSFVQPDAGRLTVLDVPHFALQAGELLALEGRSGSGKTTLLNVIAGISRAEAGEVWLDGVELLALPEARRDALRARAIGYVFQTFNLLQGYTALENVLLGMLFGGGPGSRRVAEERAAELLTALGLGDRLRYRPRQLSVGQQQRVALARALANRPRLVLADEPTGNLDAARASEALDLLLGLCQQNGAALLAVSHDPAILARFPRRLELAQINRAAQRPVQTPA